MAKHYQLAEAHRSCNSTTHAQLNHNGFEEGTISSECRRTQISTRAHMMCPLSGESRTGAVQAGGGSWLGWRTGRMLSGHLARLVGLP
jgi:hypothetical protein